jgi:hypothetical protein
MDPNTGVITGSPTTPGTYEIGFEVDWAGQSDQDIITIVVD